MDTLNNGKDLWSTGNRAKDIFGGAVIGLSNLSNRPGQYYVKSNWKGGGLADTGLGYIANQNYQNPYDQANLLTSMMYGKGKGFRLPNLNILKKSTQGGNVLNADTGNTLQDFISNYTDGYNLKPETISDYLGLETNYGGYVPQFLPLSFEDRGGFDTNLYGYNIG